MSFLKWVSIFYSEHNGMTVLTACIREDGTSSLEREAFTELEGSLQTSLEF